MWHELRIVLHNRENTLITQAVRSFAMEESAYAEASVNTWTSLADAVENMPYEWVHGAFTDDFNDCSCLSKHILFLSFMLSILRTGWNPSHSLHILSNLCMSLHTFSNIFCIICHECYFSLSRYIGIYEWYKNGSVNAWYELVLDDLAISLPILSILHRASLEVASAAMDQNSDEERRVEIWNRWRSPNAETPSKTLNPVGSVVLYENEITVDTNQETTRTGLRAYAHHPLVRRRLLYQFIRQCIQMDEDSIVPMSSLNISGILDSTPRKLRECLPPFEGTLRLHLETRLLGHRRVESEGEENGLIIKNLE